MNWLETKNYLEQYYFYILSSEGPAFFNFHLSMYILQGVLAQAPPADYTIQNHSKNLIGEVNLLILAEDCMI